MVETINENDSEQVVCDHLMLAQILSEIKEQPAWREQADKEMDYRDGNQIDSETLVALSDKGIPPSVENVIGPAIDDHIGARIKEKKDLRVEAEATDDESRDVAQALNQKLNHAERNSKMDVACVKAYEPQVAVGLGWVEVSRETDPFKFQYRCKAVHRNEIFWDYLAKEDDLSDARWLLRRRWTDIGVVKQRFPEKSELLEMIGSGWQHYDDLSMENDTGGTDTGLAQSREIERGWTIEEAEWQTSGTKRVAVYEVQVRKWEEIFIIKTSDGRVVEFCENNPGHIIAVAAGRTLQKAQVSRIYKHFYLGPHLLGTEKSELSVFNYVPFWGKREDRTNVPYGDIRWLMYLQDEINARISKMKWFLSATRTERTEGAVAMTDDELHAEVGRADADIILNATEMAKTGARFEVKSNESLNKQQYDRLMDLRQVVKQVVSASDNLLGNSAGKMGENEVDAVLDKISDGRAQVNDNFLESRKAVGSILLSYIIKDTKGKQEDVTIKKAPLFEDKQITLNQQLEGEKYLSNDVSRTKLKVAISDVNASSSYKKQQLKALQEVMKSMPTEYQRVMMPHFMALLDIPNQEEVIKAIIDVEKNQQITQEQVDEQVKKAIEETKRTLMYDLKVKELELKERKTDAEIEKLITEQVNNRIEAIYSAVQASMQIVQNSNVARSADQIMKSAGAEDKDDPPLVGITGPIKAPNMPMPAQNQNTSPMFPPRAAESEPNAMPEAMPPQQVGGADDGINRGIESTVI